MGGLMSLFKTPKMRILMCGLDGAGKTTILCQLRGDHSATNVLPTVGFNAETVKIGGINMSMWDVGGQEKFRPLWRHYYAGSDALIFVIDSSDRARIGTAQQELFGIMNDLEMQSVIVLVLANKQDLPGAESPQRLEAVLNLPKPPERITKVAGCVGKNGTNLVSSIQWVISEHKKQKKRKR